VFPSEKFPFCADGTFEVVGVEEGMDKEETGQAERIRRQGQDRAVTFKEAPVKYLVMQRRPEHVGVGGGEWRDGYDAIILVASPRKPDCYERVGSVFSKGRFCFK
jgi:hypothetical protein